MDNQAISGGIVVGISSSLEEEEIIRKPQRSITATTTNIFDKRSCYWVFDPELIRKVVAEAIATYLMVFVSCGAVAISTNDEHKLSRLGASMAAGLIVSVMIYAFGHISGAHMNPAVTIALMAIRKFPLSQVPFYATAQLIGAISAAFTLRVLLYPIKSLGTTSPSGSEFQSLVMEIVITFSMMLVCTAVATDAKANGEFGGIAVGSAVCITSMLAGPISGGSMNPVRTLGPAIASGSYKAFWVYLVGPLTGALLAAGTYSLLTGNNNNNVNLDQLPMGGKLMEMDEP